MSSRSADLGTPCEWCGEPAVVRVPILKRIKGTKGLHDSGTAMFACRAHEEIAKKTANPINDA